MKGKSLLEYIKEHQPIPENDIRTIMSHLMETLKQIHANNIAHRNIQLTTLMFRNPNYDLTSICFTDFALSRTSDIAKLFQTAVKCNDAFASPQIITDKGYYTNRGYTVKTDIWSMGVVLFGL